METVKNICYVKGEGTVAYSTVTRRFKKFCSGCKKFDDQARSGRSRTMDSDTIEANVESSNQRVSGEISISQSSVICHLHDLGKIILLNCVSSW